MANTNFNLTTLDFDTIKANLISYLKRADSPFKDVDYNGSNINQLVDVLSYNTYMNSFYLNMVSSEMFLDSAQLRDSVVSHCKELNYVPRSFRSASANVSFTVTPSSSSITSLLVPKGTTFTAVLGSNSYTFSTEENITVPATGGGNFTVDNLEIFEGRYITDTFVYDQANTSQRFVLSNPTIDTRSITVTVVENNGANTSTYTRASSLIDVTSSSKSYFVQAAENMQYEVLFGDGVVGQRPASGAVIVVEYRICNGELPNGARNFDIDGPIQGQSNISTAVTVSAASGGDVNETIDSIKFNAPRFYQNQDRAVTTADYENIILANFNEINTVAVYGGEDAIPPQYGKVVISADSRNGDGTSTLLQERIYKFIRARSPLSIEPIFVDPEFLFLQINTLVRYNANITTLTDSDVRTLVASRISLFNRENLSNFKKTLRYSRLLRDIDLTNSSFISNDTDVIPYKLITPNLDVPNNITLRYNYRIEEGPPLSESHNPTESHTVYSTRFTYDGKVCMLEDDGNGALIISSVYSDVHENLLNVGSIDYLTGIIQINSLNISRYEGNGIKIFAKPYYKDITSDKNVILEIKDEDILVTPLAVRE